MNFISSIFVIISLVLASFVGYMYLNYEFIKSQDLKNNYIAYDKVQFYNLPLEVQDQYILKDSCPKPHVQIKEVVQEKIVEKQGKDALYTQNYKVFKCYDFPNQRSWLDKQCISKLQSFLDKEKQSKFFEVIAVVSENEFKTLKSTELKLQGLAKKRAEDAMWEMKSYLPNHKNIFSANYHVKSYENKGFVVRAYY
jgi:hypothetical protein